MYCNLFKCSSISIGVSLMGRDIWLNPHSVPLPLTLVTNPVIQYHTLHKHHYLVWLIGTLIAMCYCQVLVELQFLKLIC